MAYQPLIPTGTVQLDQDYQNIQGNFQAADTAFGVDHTLFSVASQSGYHKAIHMIPQASITNVPGFPQLYSKSITDVNTDEALFYNTGTGNRTVQMTVPIVPLAAVKGYTFLPGGIIMQWGQTTSVPTGTNLAYVFTANSQLAFPNAIFNVSGSPVGSAAVTLGGFSVTAISTTGFSIQNGSGQTQQFFFIAIGN